MNIRDAQRWVHRINSTAALILLTTGVMHTLPELRSELIGGYDRLVADIHVWTGLIFITFPLLNVIVSKGDILESLRVRLFLDPTWHWRRVHLILALSVCFSQACAGAMIWIDSNYPLPIALINAIFLVHQAGAWYIGLSLPIHLWMSRVAIIRTSRSWLALE